MSKAPPRLGRGLSALLGDASLRPNVEPGVMVVKTPVDQIDANPFQPRSEFDQAELQSLADSIRTQGLLQPILIRPHPSAIGRYQIVAGERRFRASVLAGVTEIPSILRETNDNDAAVLALVENLQRQDLNPMEEAEGYQRLLHDFGLTHESLGYAVSKSRAHIGNVVRLLKLPDPVKQKVRAGALSFGHARALIAYPQPEALVDQVLKRGLSVRQTEQLVARKVSERTNGPKSKAKHVDLVDMERRIADATGYRVTITTGRGGSGEVRIAFSDLYQLEDIVDRLVREPALQS
ncbi:MAG: ParB/RepB/Spo0J family partition protein [Acetobacteraceae bacterium]|nr:ParB/RepB/Spo0J family partition protein [Pseudomonadota bacterium]